MKFIKRNQAKIWVAALILQLVVSLLIPALQDKQFVKMMENPDFCPMSFTSTCEWATFEMGYMAIFLFIDLIVASIFYGEWGKKKESDK